MPILWEVVTTFAAPTSSISCAKTTFTESVVGLIQVDEAVAPRPLGVLHAVAVAPRPAARREVRRGAVVDLRRRDPLLERRRQHEGLVGRARLVRGRGQAQLVLAVVPAREHRADRAAPHVERDDRGVGLQLARRRVGRHRIRLVRRGLRVRLPLRVERRVDAQATLVERTPASLLALAEHVELPVGVLDDLLGHVGHEERRPLQLQLARRPSRARPSWP